MCRACQPQLRAQRCRLRADGVQPQSRCVRARPARSLRTLQRVQRFVAHAGCRLIRRARRKGQRGILLSAPLPPPCDLPPQARAAANLVPPPERGPGPTRSGVRKSKKLADAAREAQSDPSEVSRRMLRVLQTASLHE